MVANHPGMSDQTDSNIARDGAAKKTVTKFPVKGGMTDQTSASKLSAAPSSPEWGPDASGPDVLDPSKGLKKFGEVKKSWGMEKAPSEHSPELGRAVLAEAANLGR